MHNVCSSEDLWYSNASSKLWCLQANDNMPPPLQKRPDACYFLWLYSHINNAELIRHDYGNIYQLLHIVWDQTASVKYTKLCLPFFPKNNKKTTGTFLTFFADLTWSAVIVLDFSERANVSHSAAKTFMKSM